jgi:3-phenylpropionate/trans-cinnamate dioxygenase ferredoxin component
MSRWVEVCPIQNLVDDDVVRFDFEGRTFAVYLCGGEVFATDGKCTHEHVHLCDGLVMDGIIECPKHNGRFDIRTGRALGAPVCVNLKTYSARVLDGQVQIGI